MDGYNKGGNPLQNPFYGEEYYETIVSPVE